MKAAAILVLFAIGSWAMYTEGYHNGFRDAQHEAYPYLDLHSNCYVPGEAHNSITLPCVTIDEPAAVTGRGQ